MKSWRAIFNKEAPLSDDELINYLKNEVNADEMHDLEQRIAASDFNMDALEGLSEFKDKSKIISTTQLLNKQLKKQISNSKSKRKNRKIENQQWIVVVTLSILLLIILGYFLIHYSR